MRVAPRVRLDAPVRRFYPTVGNAVSDDVRRMGVRWTDRTDAPAPRRVLRPWRSGPVHGDHPGMARPTVTMSLPVSSLVGSPVADIRPEATLVDVAKAMQAAGVGALVVAGPDGPSGIVSERDLVEAVAAGRDLAATTAAEVARSTLVWCDEDASVAEVASEMMDRYVRHVLVEADGRLVGVVSARDLLGVYASEDAQADVEG